MRNVMRRFWMLNLLIALCSHSIAAADLVEQSVKDSGPSGLLAGIAKADISPPVGIAHMNWGAATHIESEGNDPAGMYATAIVLANDHNRVAIVGADIGWFPSDLFAPIVDRASSRTGIEADHIFLVASHTHSGPGARVTKGPVGVDFSDYVDSVKKHYDVVAEKIAGAIIEANDTLEPAHIHGGRGIGTINLNRRFRARDGEEAGAGRNPQGFVDRDLVVFRVDNATGRPMAIVSNFQAHGTTLAWENKFVSPDWIGGLRETVERVYPGTVSIYLQGAAGNQQPVEGYTGDLTIAHRLGRILGFEVAGVAEQIDTVRREPVFDGYIQSSAVLVKHPWRVKGPRDATIGFTKELIAVPRRTYSEHELNDIRQRIQKAETALSAAEKSGESWEQHQALAKLRRYTDLLARWESPVDKSPLQLEARVLSIGDELAIVAIPGEFFAEIGSSIKKNSPFEFTMFAGYSNYTDGFRGSYMPTSEEYQYGGYEVEITAFNRGADKEIIANVARLLQSLKKK